MTPDKPSAMLALPPSPVEVNDLILQSREHVQSLGWKNRGALYTETQMRAYALAHILAERERCAKLCEAAQAESPDDGINGWLMAAQIRGWHERS